MIVSATRLLPPGIASRVRAVKRRSTIRLLPEACVWIYYGGYGLLRLPIKGSWDSLYLNSICLLLKVGQKEDCSILFEYDCCVDGVIP